MRSSSADTFATLFQRALNAARARDLTMAADLFGKAVALEPGHAAAHCNRGAVLAELERWPAALDCYDRAIDLKADYAIAHSNRGNALRELNRLDEALASFDRAIGLMPGLAAAHCNRGNVQRELAQWTAALASFDHAIALDPTAPEAYLNRGIVQRELHQLDAALASYDQAIARKPDYAEAYCNRGMVLQELRRLDAALTSYDAAIALEPSFAQAHFNRSVLLLSMGEYAAGFTGYEWRWQNDGKNAPQRRTFQKPLWLGAESLAGKRILLHAEQGLGDTLQFCRYAKLVSDLDAHVILEVPQPLLRLLGTLDGVAELAVKGGALPPFDYHCPLLSLPLAFKSRIDTLPSRSGYLRADVQQVAQWQRRLGAKTLPRVGLAWSGSQRRDNDRSLSLAPLAACLPGGIHYVSLQKEVCGPDLRTLRDHPGILDVRAELRDFADTAALCECLDLVITVDTSVAHLGGALGKPTWILLAHQADWRWLLEGDASPWYDSVKLLRQAAVNDWRGTLDVLGRRLTGR